jgi:hypothetical protein
MNGEEEAVSPARGLLQRLNGWRLERRAVEEREATLAEAVEEVVSGTEPKLRALGGYDRELGPAVERTLGYIDDLIARLPPPIELSRAAWQRDPHINAFFASVADLPLFLGQARELQVFFSRQPGATQAFAILTSTRQEKQVFGISLQEDRVRRDVAQTSVCFVEPLILGPSATETEVREEAKHCALRLFISLSREQLAISQGHRESLERERQIQEVRLRSLHTRINDQTDPLDLQARSEALEHSLAANAHALAALGGPRPRLDSILEQVRGAFARPEAQLSLAKASLRLDRLGIKQEAGTATPAHNLDLLECTTASSRRVITLVRCPREEMLTQDEILARMAPHLASQSRING